MAYRRLWRLPSARPHVRWIHQSADHHSRGFRVPKLKATDNVSNAFEEYWSTHQQAAFTQLCEEEKLKPADLEKLLGTYTFANRLPREQEIVGALTFKPKILERKGILQRIADKIKLFIDTFIEGMGGSV